MRILFVLAACASLSACSPGTSNQGGQDWQAEERIVAMDGQTWVVGSRLITVSPDAAIVGKPSVGSTVRVSGRRTDRGELVVDTVEVAQPATVRKPAPTPVPQRKPAPPARQNRGGEGEGD